VIVSIDERLLGLAREGRLQARASLCLGITEETIGRTVDNKQEILQGIPYLRVSLSTRSSRCYCRC
jgi:hypothetical protein